VIAAVGFAWVLLGQVPTVVQAVGGVLVLAGVIALRGAEPHPDETPHDERPEPIDARQPAAVGEPV
jgi:drug/metabolite transporter (DMT)-like permease